MLQALRTPLRIGQMLVAALGAVVAVTVYCLAYTALAGTAESPIEATGWTIANVCPWLVAFEAGKRSRRTDLKLLVLLAALALSLSLDRLFGDSGSLGFELLRRIPGLLLVAALLASLALPWKPGSASTAADAASLPLPVEQIDWVAAAGNYIELHGCGRVVMHRAPLSLVESRLSPLGFVRIHRSTLVRRDSIARLRPRDVLLRDGTSLKVGKRYRALLER